MESKFKWYRLDNAAKLYPDITSKTRSNMFRVAFNMTEDVDPEILQEALENLKDRFPTFFVKLKSGIFWYYYEYNEHVPMVEEESPFICSLPDFKKHKGYLFNVYYYENRIAVEVYHAVSDGTGVVEFTKALVYRYLQLKGCDLEHEGLVKTVDSKPHEIEVEDSFLRNFTRGEKGRGVTDRAYRVKGTYFAFEQGMGVINGKFPFEQLKRLAKEKQATVTAYITAAIMYSIFKVDFKNNLSSNRPVRVMLPVNMRKFYNSKTLRNFSLYIYTTMNCDGRMWTFDEILEVVKADMEEGLKKENLQKVLNANVNIEKKMALRLIPLFIKKVGMKIGYSKLGSNLATCAFSNLGEVKLPESMQRYVKNMEWALTVDKKATHNMTACTNNGIMNITFNRNIYETELERVFFRFLAKQGVEIEIESNLWEENA